MNARMINLNNLFDHQYMIPVGTIVIPTIYCHDIDILTNYQQMVIGSEKRTVVDWHFSSENFRRYVTTKDEALRNYLQHLENLYQHPLYLIGLDLDYAGHMGLLGYEPNNHTWKHGFFVPRNAVIRL